MSIEWGIVGEMAKHKSTQFSAKYENDAERVAAYNGYFAGYMENAAERESLRAINERLNSRGYAEKEVT